MTKNLEKNIANMYVTSKKGLDRKRRKGKMSSLGSKVQYLDHIMQKMEKLVFNKPTVMKPLAAYTSATFKLDEIKQSKSQKHKFSLKHSKPIDNWSQLSFVKLA